MKITKARLKEIIREELQKVVEASAEERAKHLSGSSREELGLSKAPSKEAEEAEEAKAKKKKKAKGTP